MNTEKNIKIVVMGSLVTDIMSHGVDKFLNSSEVTYGGKLIIGPGGKSRNVAQMISVYDSEVQTAMIGKTSMDSFGLWKVPIDALEKTGVSTKFIKTLEFERTGKYPSIALILVNKKRENKIHILPGISDDFSTKDIDDAEELFKGLGKNKGILAISMEPPLEAVLYAIKKAKSYGIKVILDPGGIVAKTPQILTPDIFLIKPNEHEAKLLTGVEVKDLASAREAAEIIKEKGIKNVLITHGSNGAYLFSEGIEEHIVVPDVKCEDCDETGCGDQVIAVLCAEISRGENLSEASRKAISAGVIQFQKTGIQPITKEEINYNMLIK